MKAEEITEQRAEFEEGISRWQEMEDRTIAQCDKILDATSNDFVKTMIGMVKADSQKHKEILGFIEQALEGTITLQPEELGEISALIDEHLAIEKASIDLALSEHEMSRNFVVRHLLEYLLADEKKHYKLMRQMQDYKIHLYPYGGS